MQQQVDDDGTGDTGSMIVRYPSITVELIGADGNAFNVLGLVLRALRAADVGDAEVEEFQREATAGDYDQLLRICMTWVTVNDAGA